MFIAIALMCMADDLRTCSMMIWDDTFITEEACTTHSDSLLGNTGPKGVIVHAGCFKVDDLGEPV